MSSTRRVDDRREHRHAGVVHPRIERAELGRGRGEAGRGGRVGDVAADEHGAARRRRRPRSAVSLAAPSLRRAVDDDVPAVARRARSRCRARCPCSRRSRPHCVDSRSRVTMPPPASGTARGGASSESSSRSGMPLDAERALALDRLDDAVVAPRGRAQARPGIAHRLVVDRVDLRRARRARARPAVPASARTSCTGSYWRASSQWWSKPALGRCWCSEPPDATAMSWMPRQMPSTRMPSVRAARYASISSASRTGSRSYTSGAAGSP